MSTRRVHRSPTFQQVQETAELNRILKEIRKFKPEVEVTIEHHPVLSQGRIIDWHEEKRLFTVEWIKIPDEFKESSGRRTGLRAFFKVSLFSVQVLFKCELVRRLPDGSYQYRTPEVLYKNQKRSALRVPLAPGSGALITPLGVFTLTDLSTSGARFEIPSSFSKKIHQIENCVLQLKRKKISTPRFGITLTRRFEDSAGCRFHGLNEAIHIEIKQFLIESLQDYFKRVKTK